jgi:hypothetical protein
MVSDAGRNCTEAQKLTMMYNEGPREFHCKWTRKKRLFKLLVGTALDTLMH